MEQLKNQIEVAYTRMVQTCSPEEVLLGLEAAMTQSAFGYEYALMNLNDEAPYSEKQSMMSQLENHKEVYFWARERMLHICPDKLVNIEENLKYQKQAFLYQPSQMLH